SRHGRRRRGSPCRWARDRPRCGAGGSDPPPRGRTCRCGPWRPRPPARAGPGETSSRPARGWRRSPRRWRRGSAASGRPWVSPPAVCRSWSRPAGGHASHTPLLAPGDASANPTPLRRGAQRGVRHGCTVTRVSARSVHFPDRYGRDVLSSGPPAHHRRRPAAREVPAQRDLVVEDASTGFTGAVTRVEKTAGKLVVELEDGRGRLRSFPLGPGFMIDSKPVVLTRPAARHQPDGTRHYASGSMYCEGARARAGRASRNGVEGKRGAGLFQKVWGHELRIEGVEVEMLDGADTLPERVQDSSPGPGRRLGILVN